MRNVIYAQLSDVKLAGIVETADRMFANDELNRDPDDLLTHVRTSRQRALDEIEYRREHGV